MVQGGQDATTFLLPLIDLLLKESPELLKVKIVAPALLDIEAGEDLPGSKSFRLINEGFWFLNSIRLEVPD